MRIFLKCQIPRRVKDCNIKLNLHKITRWIKKQTSNCDSTVLRFGCLLLSLVIVVIFVVWICIRDPCESYKIKDRICQDYKDGLAAGHWCYELCVENSISLTKCLSQNQQFTTFLWQDRIVKIQHVQSPTSKSKPDLPLHLADVKEPLTTEGFHKLLTKFLHSKLGPDSDQSQFLEQILKFADFNNDDEIKFGEANSVWELLHVHEFFILLLFQEDSVFPRINGTCGNLYFYDTTEVNELFNKQDKGFFDKIFSHTYRWKFPEWQKRANIVMGLLEFAGALYEKMNANFYMCDVSATKFGFERYEARVISVEHIVSQKMIADNLIGQYCYSDHDCVYGATCMTSCDNQSESCDDIVLKPSLVTLCEVIQDFLLFDTPSDIKPELVHLLSQCITLTHNASRNSSRHLNENFLQHNVVLSKLKSLIWDQIKEQPSNWLIPRYPKNGLGSHK